MLSLPTDKTLARTVLRQRRRELDGEYTLACGKTICESLLSVIKKLDADTVLMFAPISGEPNILPLADALKNLGISAAFPVSFTEDTHLEFFAVSDTEELKAGAYGIKEPPPSAPRAVCTERTVCIVPALSFDVRGMRIGHGKGYYDRFLSDFCGTAIGVVFSELLAEGVPHGEHDVPVNLVITEKGVIFTDADKKYSLQNKNED